MTRVTRICWPKRRTRPAVIGIPERSICCAALVATSSRSRMETMTDPIRFYSKIAAYHELSNFAPFGFEADGVYWPTVEHDFQAQKFPGAVSAAYREKIRAAKTPKEAKALGRTRNLASRPDREEVRDGILVAALRKNFAAGELP